MARTTKPEAKLRQLDEAAAVALFHLHCQFLGFDARPDTDPTGMDRESAEEAFHALLTARAAYHIPHDPPPVWSGCSPLPGEREVIAKAKGEAPERPGRVNTLPVEGAK